LGESLRELLPTVIQAVQPYFTPDDIEKGARWNIEISKELEESSVGILCLTQNNLKAPWLMFEAGALAKSLEKSRVIPILFGVEPSELSGPLVQFQAVSFNRDDIYKLVKTINKALGKDKLDSQILSSVYDKWWPELEDKVKVILDEVVAAGQDKELRPDRDILEEILKLVRADIYTPKEPLDDSIFYQSIKVLEFTVNTTKLLNAVGVVFIGDLVQRTEIELTKLYKFSNKNLTEVKDVLASRGLSLGMRLDNLHFQ